MKRVLALAGACLLVAAAVIVRGMITDDDDGGGGGGGDPSGDGELVVACIPELRDACEALERDVSELRIEDPAETIAAMSAGEQIDAWVTLDPWPEIANQSERREMFDDVEPVAGSELVLLARTGGLPRDCPEPPTWTCVQEGAPEKVALPRPSSAFGLLAAGYALTDVFLQETGVADFAAQDLRDDRVLGFLEAFVFTRDPVLDMLQLGPAGPTATVTTLGRVDVDVRGSREEANLVAVTGDVSTTVAVVVTGPDADRVAGEPDFTDALEMLGWQLDPSAATTGLPSAGVLIALSQEVSS